MVVTTSNDGSTATTRQRFSRLPRTRTEPSPVFRPRSDTRGLKTMGLSKNFANGKRRYSTQWPSRRRRRSIRSIQTSLWDFWHLRTTGFTGSSFKPSTLQRHPLPVGVRKHTGSRMNPRNHLSPTLSRTLELVRVKWEVPPWPLG